MCAISPPPPLCAERTHAPWWAEGVGPDAARFWSRYASLSNPTRRKPERVYLVAAIGDHHRRPRLYTSLKSCLRDRSQHRGPCRPPSHSLFLLVLAFRRWQSNTGEPRRCRSPSDGRRRFSGITGSRTILCQPPIRSRLNEMRPSDYRSPTLQAGSFKSGDRISAEFHPYAAGPVQ